MVSAGDQQRSARELLEELDDVWNDDLANYVPPYDPNETSAPFDPYQTGDTQ